MIKFSNNTFELPGTWSYRARTAPDRKYVASARCWRLPNSKANRKFLLGNFLPADFAESALAAATAPPEEPLAGIPTPTWPTHVLNHGDGKTYEVLPHQLEALQLAWGKPGFAFFHDMGSGKSLTQLLMWDALFKAGLIDEAWVVCPNPLIDNWHEQVRNWTPWNKDKICVYGILSLSAGRLPAELVGRAHGRLAVAVDESQRIKNAQAKRTRVMHEIGKHAAFRYDLTGTSITKGIEDLYSQYAFLDPDILGYKSFYTFRNRYCVMGGFENKQITGYQNLRELMETVAPFTHVVKDPVKLPPQTPELRLVQLTPEQKRLLRELKDQMQTEMGGTKLTVTNALTYYTRGAQILGGFFPLGDGRIIPLPTNNKLDELMEVFQSTDRKIVVFCRFVAEADLITEALRAAGVQVARLARETEDKMGTVNEFRTDPGIQAFVTTYGMGSLGYTMVESKILIEYSGTFNYEESVQARKRIHRIGQTEETKVIRLMANCKLDRAIKDISDRKQTLADFVNGSLTTPNALLELLD